MRSIMVFLTCAMLSVLPKEHVVKEEMASVRLELPPTEKVPDIALEDCEEVVKRRL